MLYAGAGVEPGTSPSASASPMARGSHRVLPGYRHAEDLAQLNGRADVHGPALAARADVRRLPGVPPPPPGLG